jgi:predicted enzyme related to lactoylglutathione lyase
LHGRGDNGKSQWAVLLDPNGAAFGIIPVVSEDEIPPGEGTASGDGAVNTGCISWLDLTVPIASESRDFYQAVVGWSVQDIEVLDANERYTDYKMLGDDGNPAAGVRHARGMNLGLPPIWMLYLPVGDLAESVRRVREGGGKIIKEATGADGAYAYAVVQDPAGAVLALVPG